MGKALNPKSKARHDGRAVAPLQGGDHGGLHQVWEHPRHKGNVKHNALCAAALSSLLILVGCISTPAPVADPRQIWCAENKPRRDATTETPRWVIDEINAHNAKGVLWCKWKP